MAIPPKPVTPDRLYEVGFGFGVPNMLWGEAAVQLFKRWQFGAGYGLIPGASTIPKISLPQVEQEVGFLDDTLIFTPTATTQLAIISPFIRYFPTEGLFYFQLNWGLLKSDHVVESPIYDTLLDMTIPNAKLTANLHLTTVLPTLSIGHFFWRRLFFFNVNIGASFLLSSSSTMDLTLNVPVGFATLNDAQKAAVRSQIDRDLNRAIAQIRSNVAIFPSISLTTGLMF